MSVKLVVVALLAAAATTAAAQSNDAAPAAKVVTVKTCTAETDCSCAGTDDNTKTYTVGTCSDKDSEDKYWKVDACPADDKKIVVKGYKTDDCAEKTTTFPKCKVLSYHKATCAMEGTSSQTPTVTLIAGCTPKDTADCSSGDCCSDTGATGCSTVKFTKDDACKEVGDKRYKLTTTLNDDACPSSGPFEFKVFAGADSCDDSQSGTIVEVPQACSGSRSQKAECTDKVYLKTCPSGDCSGMCTDDSNIPFKTYTERNGETLYLESCPDSANDIVFQAYAGVKQYKQGCDAAMKTQAACGEATTTTSSTTETGTEDNTTSSGSTEATTTNNANNTNNDNDNDNQSNTNNDTDNQSNTNNDTDNQSNTNNTDSGIIAPAHSVGVLALVLCLLACAY